MVATVNGRTVVSTTDTGTDQPDGRQTVVGPGSRAQAPAPAIAGVFDNVTVSVPNPF